MNKVWAKFFTKRDSSAFHLFARLIGLCAITTLTTACRMSSLSVHTDYLSYQNLASYYVNTPDPRLYDPPIGQRLIIVWSLAKPYLSYDDLRLEISMRFRNREEHHQTVPICKMRGTYVYALLNEDYLAKKGILTYKVDLIGGGVIIEEWRHQIWSDLITLEDSPHLNDSENAKEDFDIE